MPQTPMSYFEQITHLIDEIESPKQAMDDPGGATGPSEHPSAKIDDPGEVQPPPTGSLLAEHVKKVKKDIPASVDATPDATPGNVPKAEDNQAGTATGIGKDPAVEDNYKGDKDDSETTHPASGDFGEKFSSDAAVTAASDDILFKAASALGTELAADMANGILQNPATVRAGSTQTPKQAAATGAAAAETADETTDEEVAANTLSYLVKSAHRAADLAASRILSEFELLKKSGEGDLVEELGEGGDTEVPPNRLPPTVPDDSESEDAAESLLAGLTNAADGDETTGGDNVGGSVNEIPPLPENPPEELAGMSDEAALEQLAAALVEAGIDPAELAAAVAPGPKLAADVSNFMKSGQFVIHKAAKNTPARRIRDYMKAYLVELCNR